VTDDRLQALGRRFRESGTVGDEAAWLAERVRAAQLSESDLELAARLEHPAAQLALGREPPYFMSWVPLVDEDPEAAVRVVLYLAQRVAEGGETPA
jgi:hypothetical protein